MATITASSATSMVSCRGLSQKRPLGVSSSPVLGLPAIAMKGRVQCSADGKPSEPEKASSVGMSASLVAALCAATMSGPAMSLVDDRMSTEGTGLPFGLSNNLLGWILLGVFGLIWALYIIYASSLEEDEESGLSL
ncbi:photosystem II reaction center W protein, chloroplastic [Syzygium oleosum]|uniref:photosystem II reaction center W protein, chloroplastic n=1 Tax=Syzygium oleosum TaxID=219896 RepID=UPI0024B9BBF8|nr:photosystem II reaction center W protein, chloroplastic [Syzygium oleosum]